MLNILLQSSADDAGLATGITLAILAVIVIILMVQFGFYRVNEKEVIIIERLGEFHKTLTAGVNFVVPLLDWPKTFSDRFYLTTNQGQTELREVKNQTRISTQNEVFDFPQQRVITRDNASILLDAVLSYKIINPKTMIYNCTNLPNILSRLLQAHLRNVAGSLDIDQIIEESSTLNVLTGLLDNEAVRWGVKIVFVKVQKVEAPGLEEVLSKKKNADLQNKEVIIGAKAKKQSTIIESEGKRDSMVKKAEGESQEVMARARGQAQAIINQAKAESQTVQKVAKAIVRSGENPTRYLLAIKYIATLQSIVTAKNTTVHYLPNETAFVLSAQSLGINTAFPPSMR